MRFKLDYGNWEKLRLVPALLQTGAVQREKSRQMGRRCCPACVREVQQRFHARKRSAASRKSVPGMQNGAQKRMAKEIRAKVSQARSRAKTHARTSKAVVQKVQEMLARQKVCLLRACLLQRGQKRWCD
jgi:hypothetical protein